MTANRNTKGKRYTEAERRKILNHVEHVNKTRGRGGIASASREFGVTALTIGNWLNSDEPLALVVRNSSRRGPANRHPGPILRKLTVLHAQIGQRQREIALLRKEFEEIKRRI
jgi:hypothetical protein